MRAGLIGRRSAEKGLWHYLALGLSGAVLLAVLALAVTAIVIPKAAGATPLTVLTGSMEPSLPPGTLIVVRPVDIDDLSVGDVITYQIRAGDPNLITHRIVGISASTAGGRTFILQGDNNSDPDVGVVLPEQVHGRVWYSLPFVGFAATAVNGENRSWIIPLAAVSLLLYSGYMIASGAHAASKKRASRH